jgi:hypothetical protein
MKHYLLSKTASPQLKAVLGQFEAQGAQVTGGPENFYTVCPCHDDGEASLSVADGEDRVLLKCHAGCGQSEVFLAAVEFTGLTVDVLLDRRVEAGGRDDFVVRGLRRESGAQAVPGHLADVDHPVDLVRHA